MFEKIKDIKVQNFKTITKISIIFSHYLKYKIIHVDKISKCNVWNMGIHAFETDLLRK